MLKACVREEGNGVEMNGGGGPPEFVVVSSVEITAAAVKDDEVK